MKKAIYILIVTVVLASTVDVYSQRRIQYSQFQQTAILYNPAFSGMEDFVDIKLGYRNRWAGLDSSPQSLFATANTALKISTGNKYKRRGIRLIEPEAYHNLESAEEFQHRKGKRHGLGAGIVQNSNKAFSSIGGQFSYAYHLPISKFLVWSMGTSVSVFNDRLDGTDLTVLDPDIDPTYQSLLNNPQNNTNLYLNFGTVLYSFRFYLAYSANNLVRSEISTSDIFQQIDNEMIHNVILGWNAFPRYGITFVPAVMVEYSAGQTDIVVSMRAKYEDLAWGGLSFRVNDAVGANFGLYATKNIALSYQFEYTISSLNRSHYGTHELFLSFKLNNKNYSRAFLW